MRRVQLTGTPMSRTSLHFFLGEHAVTITEEPQWSRVRISCSPDSGLTLRPMDVIDGVIRIIDRVRDSCFPHEYKNENPPPKGHQGNFRDSKFKWKGGWSGKGDANQFISQSYKMKNDGRVAPTGAPAEKAP
eukprot:gene17210-52303_t